MFESIRKFLGIEKGRESEITQLDNDNSFCFSRVHNKNELLKEIIRNVPENSIWSIEGLQSKEISDIFEPFVIDDEVHIKRATIFPKQDLFKVQLTQESKKKIASNINSWNLDWEIIHQHIYKGKETYLISYDNLHEACTWISNELRDKIKKIEELIEIEK